MEQHPAQPDINPNQEALFPDPREEAAAQEAAAQEAEAQAREAAGYLTDEQRAHFEAVANANTGSELPESMGREERRSALNVHVGQRQAASNLATLQAGARDRLGRDQEVRGADARREQEAAEREARRPMVEERARVGLLARNQYMQQIPEIVEERMQQEMAKHDKITGNARDMLETNLRARIQKEVEAGADTAGYVAADDREAAINAAGGDVAAFKEREAAEAKAAATKAWQEHMGVGGNKRANRSEEPQEELVRPEGVEPRAWLLMSAAEKRKAMSSSDNSQRSRIREALSPEGNADVSRITNLSDEDIRDLDPSMMEDMTEAERVAYFNRMHALKGEDHMYAPRANRNVQGVAAGDNKRAGLETRYSPAFVRARTPSAPNPTPRTPAAEASFSEALGDFRRHTQEQAQQPTPVSRVLGRLSFGNRGEASGVIPDDFGSEDGSVSIVPAQAGQTGVPPMRHVEADPPRPERRANAFSEWYAGTPPRESWRTDERRSLIRGGGRLARAAGRGIMGLVVAPFRGGNNAPSAEQQQAPTPQPEQQAAAPQRRSRPAAVRRTGGQSQPPVRGPGSLAELGFDDEDEL
jgi:hypothetical protein